MKTRTMKLSNSLLRAINYNKANVFELVNMSEDDILNMPRFGYRHLAEIEAIRDMMRRKDNDK